MKTHQLEVMTWKERNGYTIKTDSSREKMHPGLA